MESFYSILYIHPNSITAEQYAVGLLMGSGKHLFFDFKAEKIEALAKLYPLLNIKSGLINTLKGIKVYVQELNHKEKKESLFLNDPNPLLGKDYSSYLHKYSNGMIQFSEVAPLSVTANQAFFLQLYNKIISSGFTQVNPKSKHNNFHQDFKKKINTPAINSKMDIDLKLTPSKLEGIYTPIQVRLIGKNGVLTAIQDIDFTNSIETLGQQLNQWQVLVNALNNLNKEKMWKKADYHVVFNKPETKSPQEKLLNNILIQKADLFKLNSADEIDDLLVPIKTGDYQPLSSLL